ncbi:MAG: adenylosuccinate lyase [Bacteroidota bacterium]
MSLTNISPIDGRYSEKVSELADYFSEYALMRFRLEIEINYFIAFTKLGVSELKDFPSDKTKILLGWVRNFNIKQCEEVKKIEKITNHDIKALEYWIKSKFEEEGIGAYKEFVHFGLTSQDINNTAIPLSIKRALENILIPQIEELLHLLMELVSEWETIPMLARTHGQAASPTFVGKEIMVFAKRLIHQVEMLKSIPHKAKFGGATGNFNAHFLAYPEVDWHAFAKTFLNNTWELERSYPTTQIEHYDFLSAQLDACKRINVILLDLAKDFWTYISLDYFKQAINPNETGSSAMPHKVNPIDFENAEGNLGIANALFIHLGEKLPISRMQRDLTDSTVLRNLGVPFAHTLLAIKSLIRGFQKLTLNKVQLENDLHENWAVVAEGIQTLLRKEGYPEPYEALKALTRNQAKIDKSTIAEWAKNLHIRDEVKQKIIQLTPQDYTGTKKWKN